MLDAFCLQGGVGIELWTMTEDILFDNIYVGHSPEDARVLAQETYFVKKPLETAKTAVVDDEEADEVPSFKEDPVAFIRYKIIAFIELAKLDPLTAFKSHPETGAALAGATLTFFGMLGALLGLIGGSQKPITKVSFAPSFTQNRTDRAQSSKKTDAPTPDDKKKTETAPVAPAGAATKDSTPLTKRK